MQQEYDLQSTQNEQATLDARIHNSSFIIHRSCFILLTVETRLLTSADDLALWASFIQTCPRSNLWQSPEWKNYQEALGRKTRVYGSLMGKNLVATALVIIDRTIGGLCTWDIAKGPLMKSDEQMVHSLLVHIVEDAETDKAMVLYFSPNTHPTESIGHCSMRDSDRCEQSPATRIIDLTTTHDELLSQMHQKGRYNIKIAQRDGVTVRPGTPDDIDAFYALLKSTSARDVFTISPKSHYARFLTNLKGSFFLIAEHEKTPVAGFMGVIWNDTGYYYYGASNHAKRALMAPYLLQWEAMKYCKERGAVRYDLLGIAPVGSGPEHAWAGISSFKEKFGGNIIEYPQEQQVMIRPMMWRLLQVKRRMLG